MRVLTAVVLLTVPLAAPGAASARRGECARETRPSARGGKVVPRTAAEHALWARAREHFYWTRIMARSVIPFCETTVTYGDSAWAIAKRLKLPLWTLERMNRGKDLSRLRYARRRAERLRVPALTNEALDACRTPVRDWRVSKESKPPFWW